MVVALALLSVESAHAQGRGKKPNVVISATGGTIAGAAATGTQLGYIRRVSIDTMIAGVPGSPTWPRSRASRSPTSVPRT